MKKLILPTVAAMLALLVSCKKEKTEAATTTSTTTTTSAAANISGTWHWTSGRFEHSKPDSSWQYSLNDTTFAITYVNDSAISA